MLKTLNIFIRSLGLTSSNFLINTFWLEDCLRHKQSIAAVNKNGEILAVRLGNKKSKNQRMEKLFEKFLFKVVAKFLFLLPKKFAIIRVFLKLLEEVEFDTWKMFDELGCDHIYEDKALCSSKKHRMKYEMSI